MDSSLSMLDDTSYPLLALTQSLTSNYEGMLEATTQAAVAANTVMSMPINPNFTSIPSTSTIIYGFSTPTNNCPEDASFGDANNCFQTYPYYGVARPSLNGCSACGHEITSKMCLVMSGNSYHESCCKCFECGVQLDKKCYYRDGLMFCGTDYIQRYGKSCVRCLTPIGTRGSQQLGMQVQQSAFHLKCFTCVVCGERLQFGDRFATGLNGALFCYLHMNPSVPSGLQSPHGIIANLTVNAPSLKPDNDMITNPLVARRPTRSASKSDSQDEDRDSSPESRGRGKKTKRNRTSFKNYQLREMKRYFSLNHNPDAKDLKGLAQKTGLCKRVLQVWFQNARAKYRRSQAKYKTMSPNDCILNPVKQEQFYPMSSSAGSANESMSPFEEGNPTISSFSRSISPDTSTSSSQIDGITHINVIL